MHQQNQEDSQTVGGEHLDPHLHRVDQSPDLSIQQHRRPLGDLPEVDQHLLEG